METILFDTDYLIDFLRGKSSSRDAILQKLLVLKIVCLQQ
jgi:hypothetical protein